MTLPQSLYELVGQVFGIVNSDNSIWNVSDLKIRAAGHGVLLADLPLSSRYLFSSASLYASISWA